MVDRLPQGLSTPLGERGAGLSAGERQRVALARAFLRDAPLLLLDEPTANLDGRTEQTVLDAVGRLVRGRTAVIVAHRPSLRALADRVVDLSGLAAATSSQAHRRQGERAPLLATLRVARPAAARVALASLLGAGAVAAGIGLIAAAAWLISRASQHPYESSLGLAIVAVQFFGLSRGFFRYGERLVGHDAAFRVLADLRVRVYERLEALAPTGLPAFRSGDLLARLVQDVDAFQDLIVRVIPPFAVAAVVGAATVAFIWWILPAAGLILLVCLVLSATAVPWLDRGPGPSGRGEPGGGPGPAGLLGARPDRRRPRPGGLRGDGRPAGRHRTDRRRAHRPGLGLGHHHRHRPGPHHRAHRAGHVGEPGRRDPGRALGPDARRLPGRRRPGARWPPSSW